MKKETLLLKKLYAMQVFDSRGNPTVEVTAIGLNGCISRALVPSGASTGEKEAVELRDDAKDYMGKGVSKAVENVNKIIAPALLKSGIDIRRQREIDHLLIKLDGTKNKAKLGANAILGVSMAIARLAAETLNVCLYRYLGGINAHTLPTPMLNVLNGGEHADNSVDFQEFMIIPVGAESFTEALKMASETYHHLSKILKKHNYSTLIGDEGGFAPNCKSIDEVFDLLVEAIKSAGYEPGYQGKKAIALAIDSAASSFFVKDGKQKGMYHFKKQSRLTGEDIYYKTDELLAIYLKLVKKYPLISIEDPFDENDYEGYAKITHEIGSSVQIVGDDNYCTNLELLKVGLKQKLTNSILIKLNQIGTVTETIDVIQHAQKHNFTAVVSHRSGETEDTFIADLAVALNTGQIKTGSMARTDRIAKYNQLLRIEACLCSEATYLGRKSFYNINKSK